MDGETLVEHPERYIITGGPGSGKSTLLGELKRRGYRCYEEVSRRLIREEVAKENGVLPWQNLRAFADLAMGAMLEQHERSAGEAGICFFDCGLPDIFGYLRNGGLDVPGSYLAQLATCRYCRDVFILPPWREIFVQDAERPQTYEESTAIFRLLHSEYASLGFRLHAVLPGEICQRADFLESIACSSAARRSSTTK